MADRFQELMAGWLEGNLSPAEQAEFISLLEGSDELRSLAAQDRLIDRWLHESRKPPLNADLVMEAIAQRPSELAAKTLAELNRQRFRFDHLAGEVRRLVRRLGAWVQAVRFRPLATAAGVIVLSLGIFFFFQNRPVKRIEIGKFTAVMGTPTVQHSGQRSTLYALRSTAVRLGDRIETGDADRAEIQFRDGTTLRLNFNTTLEIPNPNSEIRIPKSHAATLQRSNASRLQRPSEVTLLLGQIWTKVQKTTNAPQFAVRTPVATAAVRGTEFGLRLQKIFRAKTPNRSQPSTLSPQASTFEAVLAVREGVVDFFNSFGKVTAKAMTESVARASVAPTEPKRLATLKSFRLTERYGQVVTTSRLGLGHAVGRLAFRRRWAGLSVADVKPVQPAQTNKEVQVASQIRVVRVVRGSPAAEAGLQVGEVITALDGVAVTNAVDVAAVIATRPQSLLTLTVLRADEQRTVTLDTTQPPDAPPMPRQLSSTEARLREATQLLIEGNIDEAEHALGQLLGSDANSALYNNLGVLYETKDELGKAVRHYQRAIQAEPDVALYHFNLGMGLKSIGNLARAAEELEMAGRLAPQWAEARQELAEVFALLDRQDDALKAAEVALSIDPHSPDAWAVKHSVLLKQHHPEEARLALLKAIELEPSYAAGYGALGNVYHVLRQSDEADRMLRKAIELDPNMAGCYSILAIVVLQGGRSDEAEKLFRKAIELDPDGPLPYYNLGGFYWTSHRWDQVERLFRKAIEVAPNYANAYSALGTFYRDRGQLNEAEELFGRAMELEPDEATLYNEWAWLCLIRGECDEAEKMWLKAAELDPTYPYTYRGLGVVYQEQGKWDKALEMYDKSIKLDPTWSSSYVGLGSFYRDRGQFDEAEKLYRKALELDPKSEEAYGNFGGLALKRRQFDEAEKLFRKALELDPESDTANRGLASLREEQGKADEAEKIYRRLLEIRASDPRGPNWLARFLVGHNGSLDEALSLAQGAAQAQPQNPEFMDTLGWTHFKRGEMAEAETTLKKSIEAFGQSCQAADPWEHLGQLYEKRGDRRLAIEAYRKALSLQPENKEAKEALDRLEN